MLISPVSLSRVAKLDCIFILDYFFRKFTLYSAYLVRMLLNSNGRLNNDMVHNRVLSVRASLVVRPYSYIFFCMCETDLFKTFILP